MAAEESTAWPGVSRPTYLGGLGFGFKWNMGWMHDTLEYFAAGPDLPPLPPPRADVQRCSTPSARTSSCRSRTTRSCTARARCSGKMPGDRWQKLANLRALYAYMWAHPGKKLLFMGGELAQEREWSHERSLDWHLLERPEHRGVQTLVGDLNRVYRDEPALWELDFDPAGFAWLEAERRRRQRRRVRPPAADGDARAGLRLRTSRRCRARATGSACRARRRWREVLNTDASVYGGSDVGNMGAVEAEAQPVARPALLGRGDAAAARRRLARPGADDGLLPWERPLGARPSAGRVVARLGAQGRDVARAGRPDDHEVHRSRRAWASVAATVRARPGDDYWFVSTAGAARPGVALAARGLRGPRASSIRLRSSGPTRAGRASRCATSSSTSSTSGRSPPRARSTPRSRTWSGSPRHRHHWDRADADRGVPRRARLGLRRRLPVGPRIEAYGGPQASSASSTRPTPPGVAVILDVVYNHVGASGERALRAFGPFFTDRYGRAGARRSTTTAPTRTRCASGCCRARPAGSATSTSTGCASTPSTRSSTPASRTSSPSWRSACTRSTGARSSSRRSG